ncbi:hypothetical protein [Parasphingopyxis sp.]|uniref:hypothetical protein n=1 Tax=Parasphingopyxis sp. TaxID=1920299 RepID=UPI002637977B|nr:hypothetical protein [Parasphingopyxis sp.]
MSAPSRMKKAILLAAAPVLLLNASPAFAYLGPGLGLSAIGSALSFIGVILLMIVGFVWYPLKRLIAKMRGKGTPAEPAEDRNNQ